MLSSSVNYGLICLIICALLPWRVVQADSHHPQDFLTRIAGSKTEGQQIVEHYCATCHAAEPLIQLGAPRIQHPADWSIRLKQGLAELLKHTDQGFNAMPARGGCFECTDEQLLLAIKAMLPQKNKRLSKPDCRF